MKLESHNKVFAFILLLLFTGFIVNCSDPITEPGLTGARTLTDQRSNNTEILSEMSEDECVKFIIRHGVIIPQGYDIDPNFNAIVKYYIQAVEANPNYPIVSSNEVMHDFISGIIRVVNAYYGVSLGVSHKQRSAYELEYNRVMNSRGQWQWVRSGGLWHNSYEEYNCYGYAIGKTSVFKDPGFHSGNQPPKLPNGKKDYSVYGMALFVIEDLEELGYEVVFFDDSKPDTTNLASYQRLICIREGVFNEGFIGEYSDYHLMKYNAEDDSWYHKPGNTAPLKYFHNGVSDPSVGEWNSTRSEYVWVIETSSNGNESRNNSGYYYGDIYYIVYSVINGENLTSVNIDKIKGVAIPKAGYGPPTAITATHQFTGNITWKNSSGIPLGSSQTFAAGAAYTATINLSAINYTFQGLPSNFFTVFGAASSSFNAATGVLTAVFPPAKTAVGDFNIIFTDDNWEINGPIGVFTLFTDNTWTLEETGFYSKSPSIDSNFSYPNVENYLGWNVPFGISGYLAQNGMVADIQLTMEFPTFKGRANIYGTYTMGLEVSSGGAKITWKDEYVNELLLFGPGENRFMPIIAVPVSGRLKRFGGGDGTENKPFLIENVKHLQKIHEHDSYTTYFKLINDIDLSASYGGHIIQLPLPHFYGHFNGSGFTISNLSGYRPLTPGGGFGLFEENSGAIENLNVTGRIGVTDETRAGMIAGINRELIRNCTSRSNTRGAMIVDTNTRNNMIFDTQGFNSYAGGITGYNTGTIEECINYGDIQGKNHVGGIAGYSADYGKVLRSYNTGSVQGNSNTGGIVGYNNTFSMVSSCYNTGEVYSNGDNVGGIAGQNLFGVGNSYNTGNVTGGNNVGGIVGQNLKNTIENSYNTGNVSDGIAGLGPNV